MSVGENCFASDSSPITGTALSESRCFAGEEVSISLKTPISLLPTSAAVEVSKVEASSIHSSLLAQSQLILTYSLAVTDVIV